MIIDFHTHILPGIDDGSKDLQMSLQMLQAEHEQKVGIVVATPHFYATQNSPDEFLRNREKAYASIENHLDSSMPEILCGAEVCYFSGISKMKSIEKLCIVGTKTLLLEMPFDQWSATEFSAVQELLLRGITVVIAHVERYIPFQKNKEIFNAVMELPVYVQINASCLTGWMSRRRPLKMFENGYAHLLGSDCHNMTNRVPDLHAGRKCIAEKLGRTYLRKIDRTGEKLLGL